MKKEFVEKNGKKVALDVATVDRVMSREYNGSTNSVALIVQERTTTYPKKRMDTGFGDGLFENVEGDGFDQTRRTLIPIPNGAEEDAVQEKLAGFENACIYRILSNNLDDVISSREMDGITAGFRTKEYYKSRRVLRNADGDVFGSVDTEGKPLENRIIGKIVEAEDGEQTLEITNPDALIEYRRDIFSREYVSDIDTRVRANASTQNEIEAVSEEIKETELSS